MESELDLLCSFSMVYHVRLLLLICELGRYSRKGNDNLLQYSCLENSIHRGCWCATVHGVAKELDMGTCVLSTGHHTEIFFCRQHVFKLWFSPSLLCPQN